MLPNSKRPTTGGTPSSTKRGKQNFPYQIVPVPLGSNYSLQIHDGRRWGAPKTGTGKTVLQHLEKVDNNNYPDLLTKIAYYRDLNFDDYEDNESYFPVESATKDSAPEFKAERTTGGVLLYYLVNGALSYIQIKKKVSGGGGFGAARSDQPGDYHWYGSKELGYSLDLDMAQYQGPMPGSIPNTDNAEIGYFRTNTPSDVTANSAQTVTQASQASEILYYKKKTKVRGPDGTFSAAPASPSVSRIPNRQTTVLPFAVAPMTYTFSATASLPTKGTFSTPVQGSNRLFKTGSPKKVKLVAVISGNPSARSDAGKEMFNSLSASGLQDFKAWSIATTNENPSTLAATRYASFLMEKDPQAKTQWIAYFVNSATSPNKINGAQSPTITTGQEWCHLYGHGSGGTEIPENFVSGSHYANTEQLAMEMGQRVGSYPDLGINVTAYRIAGTELAAWIRYKIYNGTTRTKIFDHVFDGQSESFDYNEYKILKATVERVIAGANVALPNYKDRINAKINARDAEATKNQPNETKAARGVGVY